MNEPLTDPIAIELAMLRDFYTKWAGLHSIPRDKLHRRKQEFAAQEMVDAAHTLANFYRIHPAREEEKPRLELVHG
jgi:hypothetical protein